MRKEYKRSLIKFSNYSLCVTLPKAMLNKLGLDKGDDVMITMKRGKIILEPAQPGAAGSADEDDNDNDSDSDQDNWEPLPELKR